MSSEDDGPDQGESGNGGQGGQGQGGQPQGGQGQGGQPQGGQGGQPQGGQAQPAGGQPQGGQAQGGQPQGGQAQPAGGQPQGGYQQQGAAYQESVADIFSKPATMDQIQAGLVFYALAGFGIGLAGFMYANQYTDTQTGAQFTGGFALIVTFLLGPLLAVPVGLRIVDALAGVEQDQMIYGTAGAVTVVGNVLLVLLFRLVIALEVEGKIKFGKFFITSITGGVGAAIVAIGAAYFVLNQVNR